MTPPTARRDAAERLAVLLEDRDPDAQASPDLPEEDQALASLAAALRTVPVPTPPMRAEARADLRAAVLDAARIHRPEAPLLTRLRDGARRLRYSTAAATGVGATAMALSGGGVALAAEHAGPGDALYDVKLVLEDLRLGLTFDEGARGARAMSYAMDRIAEAREATADGDDAGSAEALRGAADRTRRGSELLLSTGLVEPVRELAQDLADQVAAVEDLRPDLGPEGIAAADELIAAIVVATEGVLEILDVSELPIGIPVLPALPVPEQSATPTPVPTATATATDLPSAAATPTPTATPAPTVDEGLPLTQPSLPGLPTGPVEDAVDDVIDGVGGTVDGTSGGTTGTTGTATGGLSDTLGDVIEETGVTVDDLGDGLEDILDGVVDSVAPLVPAPLEDTVDQLPGTVDDVIDVVPDLLDPVGGVQEGLGGVLGSALGGLL